jgi:peroxiredoxin Q/BCP
MADLLPVIGKPAPDFALTSHLGDTITLKQFKGKKTVVLFFYPADDSPGCTKEACSFRDSWYDFDQMDVVILGISPDDVDSHQSFHHKHQLIFDLLSDPTAATCKAYGVWKQKNNFGKKGMGVERTTFIIDKTGRIAQIYPKVKVDGHIPEILSFLRDED